MIYAWKCRMGLTGHLETQHVKIKHLEDTDLAQKP